MSERFVMRDAVSALRATSGESHDADATRRRIVGTVVQRKRQRRTAIALVMFTFIGLPLGTTAYAAFFGMPAFVQQLVERVVAPSANSAQPPVQRRALHGGPGVVPPAVPAPIATPTSIAAPTPTSARPIPAPAPSVAASPTPTAPVARSIAVARRNPAIANTDKPAVAPTATTDPSDALYARAHELHFVARDPAAALVAWDAYLAQAPSATLLPEAKYNRALCLVRLRRNSDAIDELTPFANGSFGNYRKREATALLQALRR